MAYHCLTHISADIYMFKGNNRNTILDMSIAQVTERILYDKKALIK